MLLPIAKPITRACQNMSEMARMNALLPKCMMICMSAGALETTIRVPIALRDRIREVAEKRGVKQSEAIELAFRELAQADFLRSVASVEWDAEAVAEALEWDDAAIDAPLEKWDEVS